MNHPIFTRGLLTTSLVVASIVLVQAQGISSYQLLQGGSRCDHVIDLIHHHGVNNSVNLATPYTILHQSPYGSMVIPETELGDLEIVQINRIANEDVSCGPKIAVTVRNQSCRKVCDFHVSAVAILGRICPTSPNATVRVEQIGAGEALEIVVQLPIEAFAMGNRDGQIIGFQTLVVAIDSFDEFVETNEANNLKAMDLSQIPLLTTIVETVEVVSNTPVETAIEQTSVTAEAAPITTDDSSQVDQPIPDPLQSAIQQLGVDAASEAPATIATVDQ